MTKSTKRSQDAVDDARDQPIDVRSVELEDEDGNPVVIAQQNTGPGNQVGDGDFKARHAPTDPGEAADVQGDL